MSKKVLIITYYWPPSGGGGVQRWLKFSKYLPEFGWETTICTPENPEFELKDDSLIKDVNPNLEVLKLPIWEPFGFYKRFFKSNQKNLKQGVVIEKSKLTWKDKFIVWVRANVFIPDPRVFWVRPTARFLEEYIRKHQIQTIITTGPPHSVHLIGRRLKKKIDIKWIADFRDPWSKWDVLEKLNANSWTKNFHKKLECSVAQTADRILTVSPRLALDLENMYGQKVDVITNGFDETDIPVSQNMKPVKFAISHVGLLNEGRNPNNLWEVLNDICLDDKQFKNDLQVNLAGVISESILDELSRIGLMDNVNDLGYIDHEKAIDLYADSYVLLLLLNKTDNSKWILPGKFFEYLMTDCEILTLGNKDSDLFDLQKELGIGAFFEYENSEELKAFILRLYDRFKSQNTIQKRTSVKRFYRRNLTNQLSILLEEINE